MTPQPKAPSNGIGLTAEQNADMNRQVEAGYLASQGRFNDQLQRDVRQQQFQVSLQWDIERGLNNNNAEFVANLSMPRAEFVTLAPAVSRQERLDRDLMDYAIAGGIGTSSFNRPIERAFDAQLVEALTPKPGIDPRTWLRAGPTHENAIALGLEPRFDSYSSSGAELWLSRDLNVALNRFREFSDLFRPQVCVPLQLIPGLVKRELCNFMNLVSALEQSASRLVAHVVKSKILDTKNVTGTSERAADALRLVWKHVVTAFGLALNNRPRLRRVLESSVVPFLCGRVLRIANQARARFLIVVVPLQSADLSLTPSRVNGEPEDIEHRYACPAIPPPEVVVQLFEFVEGRASVPSPAFADQAKFPTGVLASSTISGFAKTPFTLLAARSTTAIHVRSFPTVAGPAPFARRDRA